MEKIQTTMRVQNLSIANKRNKQIKIYFSQKQKLEKKLVVQFLPKDQNIKNERHD